MEWLSDLNEQQRAAVTAGDGPVLIVAGPGTGKTKTLTARIAYLVASGRAQPGQILALTFTKKAAEEMQSRVDALLSNTDANSDAPHVATFHALCHELLGGDASFVSDAVRLQIVKQLTRPKAYAPLSVRELGLQISRYKNQAEDDGALGGIAAAYDAALAERGLLDFDDLLVKTKQLLQSDETIRHTVQQRYTHVLVDEFQDTNLLQYELLQLLLGHDNIFVIGDPNQSIYGFRGASDTIFTAFTDSYPAHKAITLTVNYRSTPAVVAVGNGVFADAPQLQAHSTAAGAVQAVAVLNEYSEANWIIDTIQRAVGGGDFMHAVSDNHREDESALSDFAVLYRNRSAAAAFQKALAASGLPYQVVGDGSPYDQPQVQTLVALLRAVVTGNNTPPDGITTAAWQMVIERVTAAPLLPQAIAAHGMAMLGFEPTPELQQFSGMLVRFKTADAAVHYIDTIAESGFYDASTQAVTLLTIHASKGLEFEQVFVVGAEEGILPHAKTAAAVAEERRLFYVAVTRARRNLTILHTRHRGGNDNAVSRFVAELPTTVLPRIVDPQLAADQRRAHKRAAKRSQQSLF